MKNPKQLLVKSHIQEIKSICEQRGIDYEIYQEKPKVKLTEKALKEAYQKLANSKNYEKEMKL